MSKILISGLVNVETTCSIGEFPIAYQPIDYNFFGVNMEVSGVGYNIAKALNSLGDDIDVATFIGKDSSSKLVAAKLDEIGAGKYVSASLEQNPASVVLYDSDGRRRIYCDLKDIQEKSFDYSDINVSDYDIAVVCNINFSRQLLKKAKEAGVTIFTDVHVLSNIEDDYNKEFMENADVLFLSNEAVIGKEKEFIESIANRYDNKIIVMGCGSKGALMYVRAENKYYNMPASTPKSIVNTVGAGDALFSSFVCLYAKGFSPEKCLEMAQKFAAHKIGYDGASNGFMSYEELCLE